MHKWLLALLLLWAAVGTVPAMAQSGTTTVEYSSSQASAPEMADALRRDGKIYIVVIVLVSVLLGVLFYLINLDKKVSHLEKELRQ